MRYVNRSRWWRQAGDVMVPPGGVTPDLDAPPVGPDWEPVEAQEEKEDVSQPTTEAVETKRGGRK